MNGSAQIEITILYTLSAIELTIHAIKLPMSGINLFLIGRTSLIHPNLKFILLYQSGSIFIRGLNRLLICALKFILADPLASEYFQPMHFLYQLSAYNRNFIPHIIIIERIMATVMTKTYERKRDWHFSIIWSSIVFFVSLYDAFTTSPANTSIFGLITTFALLILGFFEFLIFIWLWKYNQNEYKRSLEKNEFHSLTQRYQLSENIRIGKQLTPTLILQLMNIVVTLFYLIITNFGIQFYPNIMLMITLVLIGFSGLLIEITMIIYHPFLRRDFCRILLHIRNTLCCCCCHGARVNNVNEQQHPTPISNGGIALRDIINGEILTQNSTRDHFSMLKEAWEKK